MSFLAALRAAHCHIHSQVQSSAFFERNYGLSGTAKIMVHPDLVVWRGTEHS